MEQNIFNCLGTCGSGDVFSEFLLIYLAAKSDKTGGCDGKLRLLFGTRLDVSVDFLNHSAHFSKCIALENRQIMGALDNAFVFCIFYSLPNILARQYLLKL